MTIESAKDRNDHIGDGSTVVFAYEFRILAEDDLAVYVDDVLQTLTTHYSISGVDDPAGGTVIFVTAPASGTAVALLRNMDLFQPVDYSAYGSFPEDVHEKALDRAVMQIQQLNELLKRALTGKASDSTVYELPTYAAGEFWKWDEVSNTIKTADIKGAGDVSVGLNVGDVVELVDIGGIPKFPASLKIQDTITGAATSVISANLVALRVLASDAYGKIQVATATVDEVNRLSGVTSGVQDQIDDRSMILLSTINVVSGDTNVEFASGIDSTYYEYQIHMQYVTPLTDAVHMALKMSSDGGATYYTGASDNQYAFVGHNAVGGAQGGGTANSTEIQLTATGNIGNAANEVGVSGVLKLFYPSRAAYTNCHWNLNYNATDGTVSVVEGTGQVKVAASINAIIFQFSAGNFGYGKFQLYGINRT